MSTERRNAPTTETEAPGLAWWREARFGMFIHWGLYALPAGLWNGEPVRGLGEWIMHNARIPAPVYEKLARSFNPVRFDAAAWAGLARRAGMKYLIITAKHHDGFAMFKSSHPYNIVDATPYGRDPMSDLAEACRKEGLRFGFYYSQTQDWHAPGGAGHWDECDDWHRSRPPAEAFQAYLDEKVKPQVRELLAQYGPISVIWFDTPVNITPEQSLDLKRLVKSLQPECLVSGRIGNDLGDYGSMGDNMIPLGRARGDWETPATLNDTWGFRSDDANWKSPRRLIRLLTDLAGKGVNYLLNVGPTAEGEIPEPSVRLLEAVGRWMDLNGESIYGSQAGPFPCEMPWGTATTRGHKLYLHLNRWPEGALRVRGLRSRVVNATLLDGGNALPFRQETAPAGSELLEVDLPETAPGPDVCVIRLDLDGEAEADARPLQQDDGALRLPSCLARVTEGAGVEFAADGVVSRWESGAALEWDAYLARPGRYRVEVVARMYGDSDGPEGELAFEAGDVSLRGTPRYDRPNDDPRAQHHRERVGVLGEMDIEQTGFLCLRLSGGADEERPLRLVEARLAPAAEGRGTCG